MEARLRREAVERGYLKPRGLQHSWSSIAGRRLLVHFIILLIDDDTQNPV